MIYVIIGVAGLALAVAGAATCLLLCLNEAERHEDTLH